MVENTGFMPSFTSQQGKNRKAVRPVRAELELPEGVELVGGERRVELGHIEGAPTSWRITQMWASGETDNRKRAEWVVRVKEAVQADAAKCYH